MRSDIRLRVDDRWTGRHGIARFGHEVLSRLTTPYRRLGGPVDPLSPADLANPRRLFLGRRDVVFSPGFNAGPTVATQLLTLHDLIHLSDPAERGTRKTLYYERIVRPAVTRAGRVFTVSATSRVAVREWLDDAVDVVDVGNGCSDIFFSTSPQEHRSGVLYVGNLKPHKNPETAFAAVAASAGTRLTVVTSDTAEAATLAARHGITDRTVIRSGVSDEELTGLYGSASALVFPSLAEGFGLPAAEALAMGCPVIHWAGCASVAEIVSDDGVRIDDANDVPAWRDAIAAAEQEPPTTSARDRLRAQFSWDAVAGRVESALAGVLGA